MKKFLRTLISVTVAVAILMGMGICAFAAEDKPVYTCLGDSNSAGHGLDEWYENRVPVAGAYHSIIAEALGAELRPFGSGGYRTDEIRYIVDPEFEMDWSYAEICNGEVHKDKIDAYKEDYIQAVVDADYITIQVGANDIMGDALGFAFMDYYNPIQAFENLKAMFDGEGSFNESMLQIINTLDELARALVLATELYKNVQATYPEFQENWDAIIKNIRRLNPDATIIVLSAVNSFNNVTLFEGAPVKGGKIFDIVIDKLNNWIANESEYKDEYYYCDVTDLEYTELAITQPDFWDIYLPLVHPDAEQHQIIADRVLDILETGESYYGTETLLIKVYKAISGFFDAAKEALGL